MNDKNAITRAITAAMFAGLITAAASLAAPARADVVFTMCPDGLEGVVGGHTTCGFAANVRRAFYASGMSSDVVAYSPAMVERYEMTCFGHYLATFIDGGQHIATHCVGGDNNSAEVVIW
jgi:hypothetical protein